MMLVGFLLRARAQAGRAAGVEVLGERGPDRRAAGEVWSLADLYFFAVLGPPLLAKRVAHGRDSLRASLRVTLYEAARGTLR